jgi:hypothetical protein
MYQVTQDNNLFFIGSEDECFIKLQSLQSNSAMWAMKYEGWKITPFTVEDYKKALSDYDKYTGQHEDANEQEKTSLNYKIERLAAAINKYENA